jgi:hypothetical protein
VRGFIAPNSRGSWQGLSPRPLVGGFAALGTLGLGQLCRGKHSFEVSTKKGVDPVPKLEKEVKKAAGKATKGKSSSGKKSKKGGRSGVSQAERAAKKVLK